MVLRLTFVPEFNVTLMPKSTKRFVLSTSQLNSHGFRSLTEGVDLTDFIANPIMYWLHTTPEGKSSEELLPIGFWEDIKKEGDEITAVPNFDDNDEFAMKIYNKAEHGTLRAASVEVEPIAVDADKKNWVKGQKLPTVTRWKIGEASIVDRGSNKGALVKLKHKDNVITPGDALSAGDFFESLQNDNMKIKLNEKTSQFLKLAEGAELDATEIVEKLVEVIEERDGSIKLAEEKVTGLEDEVKKLEDAAAEGKIVLMVDKAISERKILPSAREQFITLAKKDLETTQALLDGLKPAHSVKETLARAGADTNDELTALLKQNFDELLKNGGADKLRKLDPESYKLKYKAKFGKEPERV
jgi:hypothetical protein